MHRFKKFLSDLKSNDDKLRLRAVKVLQNYKESEVVEHLTGLLNDYNPEIRIAVITALGKIKDEKSVAHLLPLLSDRDKEIKKAAIEVMGQMGDYRAINQLRSIARLDHSEEIRKAAEAALEDIDMTLREMLDKLEEEFDNPNPENRKRAIRYLTTIGTKSAVKSIFRGLIDENQEVQHLALDGLDKLRTLGIEPFIKGLEHKHWKVRIACAQFLGKMKCQEALEPLVDLLDVEDNMNVKKSVAMSLGELGLEDSLYHLRNLLSKDIAELNSVILNSISQIGGYQAIEYMVTILREEKGDTALMAEEHLVKEGYKVIPILLEDFYDPKDRNRVTITKRIIGGLGKDAIDYFLQQLGEPDPARRRLAVEFLGEMGSEKTINALVEVVEEDSDSTVKKTASRELNKLRKKFKSARVPSFKKSESLLDRVSTFFSDQIEKLGKVRKPGLNLFRRDKFNCAFCGGIISRRASTVDLDRGRTEVMRFGMCPECERICCKGCAKGFVVRGLTVLKCPNCNEELNPV